MRCRCHSDHMHKSKFEASVCNTLRLRKLAGDIADYKSQPRFELKVNGKKVCNHYPDFLILNNNGSEEILEAKSDGTVTQLWRLKKALTEILFPDIPYKVEWQKRSNYPLKMMLKRKINHENT